MPCIIETSVQIVILYRKVDPDRQRTDRRRCVATVESSCGKGKTVCSGSSFVIVCPPKVAPPSEASRHCQHWIATIPRTTTEYVCTYLLDNSRRRMSTRQGIAYHFSSSSQGRESCPRTAAPRRCRTLLLLAAAYQHQHQQPARATTVQSKVHTYTLYSYPRVTLPHWQLLGGFNLPKNQTSNQTSNLQPSPSNGLARHHPHIFSLASSLGHRIVPLLHHGQ